MHLRRTTSLLVLAALVAVAPLARAADDKDKAQAREHYRRGSKAFDLQRYDEAAAEYSKVYELIDDPGLLFNIGQALRLGGQYQKAIGSYRSYLHRVPESPLRDEALRYIAESRRKLDEQEKAAAAAAAEAARREAAARQQVAQPQPAPQPAVVVVDKPRGPTAAELAAEQHHKRTLRLAGIGVGAVGVGALVAGAVFAGLTASANNTINNPPRGAVWDVGYQNRATLDRSLSISFFAVGGAALVTGVALVVVGARHERPRSVALMPAATSPSLAIGF